MTGETIARARIHVRAMKDSIVLQEFRYDNDPKSSHKGRFYAVTLEPNECTDTSAAFVAYWFDDPDWESLPPEILGFEYPTTMRRRTVKERPGGPPLDYPVEKHRGIEYVRSYVRVDKGVATDCFVDIGFIRHWKPEELQTEMTDLYDGLLPLELEWTKLPRQIKKVEFPETRMGRFGMPCNYEIGLDCIDTTAMKGRMTFYGVDYWTAWTLIESVDTSKLKIGGGGNLAGYEGLRFFPLHIDAIFNQYRDDPRIVSETLIPIDYDWSSLPAEVYHIEFYEQEQRPKHKIEYPTPPQKAPTVRPK